MYLSAEEVLAVLRFYPTRQQVERHMLLCMFWAAAIQSDTTTLVLHAITMVCSRPIHAVMLSTHWTIHRCGWNQVSHRLANCAVTTLRMMIPASGQTESYRHITDRLRLVQPLIAGADVDLLNCPQEPTVLDNYLESFSECRQLRVVYASRAPTLPAFFDACSYLSKVTQIIVESDFLADPARTLQYLFAPGAMSRTIQVNNGTESTVAFFDHLVEAIPKLTEYNGPRTVKVIISHSPDTWMIGFHGQLRVDHLDGVHVCNRELRVCAEIHIKRSNVIAKIRHCF